MGLVDELKFHVWDNVGAVVDVIKKWKPRSCESEKDYENALCRKLKKHFPKVKLVPQYYKNGVRGDIVIGDVLIEIKKDPKSIPTLIGQLMRYKERWQGRILVLLVGKETSHNVVEQLEEFVQKENLGPGLFPIDWWNAKVTILKK